MIVVLASLCCFNYTDIHLVEHKKIKKKEDILYMALWQDIKHAFYSPQENVVNLLPDEGPQPQELSINPVQDGLEEVPLPRVLAVKQLQQLKGQTKMNTLTQFSINQ